MDPIQGRYGSISNAVKLINRTRIGDERKLKGFVDNVTTAFQLINANERALLLNSVKTKITAWDCGFFYGKGNENHQLGQVFLCTVE